MEELTEMFSDGEKRQQFKEKLANKFAKDGNCPCGYYEFTDEVARFCNQEECNDLCDPTECWLRVLEQIEKEK